MPKLSIENFKPVITGDALTIKSIASLYEDFEIEDANKHVVFIHIMSRIDPEAPFYNVKEEELEALVTKNIYREIDFFKDNSDLHERLMVAIEDYKKAYETVDIRMDKIYSRKLDQIAKVIEDTEPKITENKNDKTGAITFSTNLKMLKDIMTEYTQLMEAREKLREKNVKESRTRGGKKPSFIEKQQMKQSGLS